MQTWILDPATHALSLTDAPAQAPKPGGVIVAMKAVPLLSYFGRYVAGDPAYWRPDRPFTPGTNGVGTVRAVGQGVHHLRQGQRVLVQPYHAAAAAVAEPAEILIGLTGISPDSGPLLADWPDGSLREDAQFPAAAVVPLDGLDETPWEQLATLGKLMVPMGGLRRGRLAPGETLIVNGATGYFGSAAVMLGLAFGTARVVAAGRDAAALEGLAAKLGPRVVPVILSGDIDADTAALRSASGGGAELALDLVGAAGDAHATLACRKALRRFGRLVLMGSMSVPLPIDYRELLLSGQEVIGNFMYRPSDVAALLGLLKAGLIDLGKIAVTRFDLADLQAASAHAAGMRSLDCTVVRIG